MPDPKPVNEAVARLRSKFVDLPADAWYPTMDDDIRAVLDALEKIDAIRNSIIGTQMVNWSEHVYPLVAVLGEIGMKGQDYAEAKKGVGTLLEREAAAHTESARLRTALMNFSVMEADTFGGPETPCWCDEESRLASAEHCGNCVIAKEAIGAE